MRGKSWALAFHACLWPAALALLALVPMETALAAKGAGVRAFEQTVKLDDGTVARMWLDGESHHITELVGATIVIETPRGRIASVLGTGRRVGDLRIIEMTAAEPEPLDDGRQRWQIDYQLEPLTDGEVVLRSLTINTSDSAESEASIERSNTRALTLEVYGGLPAGVSLINPRDIALPEAVQPQLAWVPVGGVLLVGVLVVGWLGRWLSARLARARAATLGRLSPLDACLASLVDIERAVAADGTGPQTAWAELSRSLRDYLEGRFAMPAQRRTTEEITTAARLATGVDSATIINDIFRHCDTARFSPGGAVTALPSTLARTRSLLTTLEHSVNSANDPSGNASFSKHSSD